MSEYKFKRGIQHGLPICFGYFAVSFAFGIYAYESGLTILQCLIVSMTNVTSAGQFAAIPIMAAGGTLVEMIASQLIINSRYILMSISLSQKLGSDVRTIDRFIIPAMDTDEIFAIATTRKGTVGRKYLYGLILTPWIGWSAGTLLGAVLGKILPDIVVEALGLAIYAMFIAIIVPPMKQSKPVVLCVAISVLMSCGFKYIPLLTKVNSGFVIIICAVVASAVCAIVAPIKNEEEGETNGE